MTANPQPASKSPSRRAVLAGALGVLAASAIGRPNVVQAHDPDDVALGTSNASSTTTSITNDANANAVLHVSNTAGGNGVNGSSDGMYGVFGSSSSNVGVSGYSDLSIGVAGGGGSTGVWGETHNGNGNGVYGSATSGHGVHGIATTGFAGHFSGKVYVSKFQEMPEVSTPSAPSANKARLFVRNNGSGKTQLCVRFPTGAVQVIKTEP